MNFFGSCSVTALSDIDHIYLRPVCSNSQNLCSMVLGDNINETGWYLSDLDLNKIMTNGKLTIGDMDTNIVQQIVIRNVSYQSAWQHVYVKAEKFDVT